MHEQVEVPDGDLLVHAGDLTNCGELEQVASFNAWLGGLPHAHKVVIAGNHDFCFEDAPQVAEPMITNAHYLIDSSVRVEGITIYGSPWQPRFCDWAFNLNRGTELRGKWDLISPDTDILVTHGPARGYGGETIRGDEAGCEELLAAVHRIRPQLHVFGHIHEGYGSYRNDHTSFLNTSICTIDYDPSNPPLVYEWNQR
jgi:Icc-related predicted phosphoesterase